MRHEINPTTFASELAAIFADNVVGQKTKPTPKDLEMEPSDLRKKAMSHFVRNKRLDGLSQDIRNSIVD